MHSRTSRVVNGSAALRSMRTHARAAPRSASGRARDDHARNELEQLRLRPSVGRADSALVPTPVWNTAAFAGRSSSDRTRAPIAPGSRSGSSASARRVERHPATLRHQIGELRAETALEDRDFLTPHARSAPMRLWRSSRRSTTLAPPRASAGSCAPSSIFSSAAGAKLARSSGVIELDRGVAAARAAADDGHLAETLRSLSIVSSRPAGPSPGLSRGRRSCAGSFSAHHDLALVYAGPRLARPAPDLVIGQRREHGHGLQRTYFSLSESCRAAALLAELRQLGGELGPASGSAARGFSSWRAAPPRRFPWVRSRRSSLGRDR